MTSLALAILFGLLALFLLDNNWRAGLIMTFVIGFLQDPIRKITPDQPSSMVGLVLVAFLLTLLVIYEQLKGRIDLRAMFWTTPEIQDWIPIYFGLIGLQAFNSYARFGDFSLVILGAAFYVAPAIALWSGFVVGCNPRLLGRLITTYLILCSVFAVSAFLAFKIGRAHV